MIGRIWYNDDGSPYSPTISWDRVCFLPMPDNPRRGEGSRMFRKEAGFDRMAFRQADGFVRAPVGKADYFPRRAYFQLQLFVPAPVRAALAQQGPGPEPCAAATPAAYPGEGWRPAKMDWRAAMNGTAWVVPAALKGRFAPGSRLTDPARQCLDELAENYAEQRRR